MPAAANAPIGILDSGLGGLSVLREVQRLCPHESVVYLADTAHVPYGDKPLQVVRDLALRLTEVLVQRGCKLVIMASGTSTVAGLEAAQARYPAVPILGTIDVGARAALDAATGGGTIGVLATAATVQSRAFTRAVQALAPGRNVAEVGCPRFVPLVETGCAETADALEAARAYLRPLSEARARAIILGCTHFPFLLSALQQAAREQQNGPLPLFVDPAEEVVREARALLTAAGLAASPGSSPVYAFAATSDPQEFGRFASLLLGAPLPPVASLSLPRFVSLV